MKRARAGDRGFGILEFVLTASLGAALLALLSARILQLSSGFYLKREARALAHEIEAGVLRALRFDQTVEIRLERAGWTDGQRHHLLFGGIRWEQNSNDRLSLSPHGTCTPKTVVLTDGGQRCAVVLALYCRARIAC